MRVCEEILQDNPQNGNTMAMYALYHNAKKNADEAMKLIKQAMRLAPKSVYPWHIYGIINRSSGEYGLSLKGY